MDQSRVVRNVMAFLDMHKCYSQLKVSPDHKKYLCISDFCKHLLALGPRGSITASSGQYFTAKNWAASDTRATEFRGCSRSLPARSGVFGRPRVAGAAGVFQEFPSTLSSPAVDAP